MEYLKSFLFMVLSLIFIFLAWHFIYIDRNTMSITFIIFSIISFIGVYYSLPLTTKYIENKNFKRVKNKPKYIESKASRLNTLKDFLNL